MPFEDFSSDEQRYHYIGSQFVTKIVDENVDFVGIEGYAMGAKGRVFHIGENTVYKNCRILISDSVPSNFFV